MDQILTTNVECVQKNLYSIRIPGAAKNIVELMHFLEAEAEYVDVVNAEYLDENRIHKISVNLIGEKMNLTGEDGERYILDIIEPFLCHPKDRKKRIPFAERLKYSNINDQLEEFYKADEENHAVFCLVMDKKTKHINGVILGERDNIMSGIAHSLSRDNDLLMDVAQVVQRKLLEGAIDALNEIKDK